MMDKPVEAPRFSFMFVGLARTMKTASEVCVADVVTVIESDVVAPLACATRACVGMATDTFSGIVIDAALNINGGGVMFAGVAVNS